MTVWKHMIDTTASALVERLFERYSPDVRCISLAGFYTAVKGSDVVDKNHLGFKRIDRSENVKISWSADSYIASMSLLDLLSKARSAFGIPTFAMTELGLIYLFKGNADDPKVIKESFATDSTKGHYYQTRRAPNGYCAHPNDWIDERKREFIRSIIEKNETPPSVIRRLRDTFFVTMKIDPDIMSDESIMNSIRLPFMSMVCDKVQGYQLKGIAKGVP